MCLAATGIQEAHLSLHPLIRSFVRSFVRTKLVFWQLLAAFGSFLLTFVNFCQLLSTLYRDQLDGPARPTSWTDQLDRPAGQTSWMDQPDGAAGQAS